MASLRLVLTLALAALPMGRCQDYEVADVKCYQPKQDDLIANKQQQQMVARLRKPEGFRGNPLFADDLRVNPRSDTYCSILPEPTDLTGRIYRLTITDFSHCGVTHHAGYVHVRIWFPLLPSAMTSQDQEVILVCKPPELTVLSTKATEISSTSLGQARVSGVVEESSLKLEYQVAIYRHSDEIQYPQTRPLIPPTSTIAPAASPYLVPLEEAVPIGTRLQLRANINPQTWKYAKLVEVTVSPDPQDPHADGHVRLLHLGCRTPEMRSLMRTQARRATTRPSEVWLDFEAFYLSSNYSSNKNAKSPQLVEGQQWIHTTVLACVEETDCRPDVCGDPIDPAGYGRRRKRSYKNDSSNEVHFDNRVPIRIIVPGDDEYSTVGGNQDCRIWMIPMGVLISTSLSSLICLFFTCRWHAQKKERMANIGPEQTTIVYPNRAFQRD